MDDETRFWIAQQASASKHTADIKPLFRKAKAITGKGRNRLISDRAPNFHAAYNREFWTMKYPKTNHIRNIRLQGDRNNNMMERLNGGGRDREKVMRGFKKVNTSALPGYQMYHDYFRPHEGIGNVTPAEKSGIKIKGDSKWITVIQNAKREKEND